jgi:hypothetical protein
MTSQELDEIRAETDGMIDRRTDRLASQDKADSGTEEDLRQQIGFLEAVLDGIASRSLEALNERSAGKTHLLYEIRGSAHAALRRPPLNTRVKRLIQPAGDLGTIIGWHHELQLPEIEWDSQRGLPAEACEPNEFTTDLNEQINR